MWWFGVCGLNETYLIYFLVIVFSPGVSRFKVLFHFRLSKYAFYLGILLHLEVHGVANLLCSFRAENHVEQGKAS